MSKSSPPPAPDYQAAAIEQGKQNNPNVVSPYGTQTYDPGHEMGFDAQTYLKSNPDILMYGDPRFINDPYSHWLEYGQKEGRQGAWFTDSQNPTLTQQFSPQQQAIFDQSTQNQLGLGRLGGQGISAMRGLIGTGLDLSKLPAVSNAAATRQRVIDAMMSRANEDYGRQTDQVNSDLIAAGIRPGSKAYADRMQMIERSRNDARTQAEIAGGNAAAQEFGMDAQRRREALAELLTSRQVPLNEVTALMSGSQVNNPFAMPGYAPAPTFAATQAASDYATNVYNANAARESALMGGLFSLAGSGIRAAGSAYGGGR